MPPFRYPDSGIHICTDRHPSITDYTFRAFSAGWQTCVSDLSSRNACHELARKMSKQVTAPVLCYSMYDRDAIEFYFYQNGKCVSRYFDDPLTANKNLFGIPALIGYPDGNRRRLSHILGCVDVMEKTAMLEEFFGVALIPAALSDAPEPPARVRGDALYRDFIEREKMLDGKHAPVRAELISEIDGKLFLDRFGRHDTVKEHCYLHGYASEQTRLTPMRFAHGRLAEISETEFHSGRVPRKQGKTFYDAEYGNPCRVVFHATCPAPYAGKTMTLPQGFWPFAFDHRDRLLLTDDARLWIADEHMNIFAKLNLKGGVTDFADGYILTTGSHSFYAYCYDPGEKIRIYRLTEHAQP